MKKEDLKIICTYEKSGAPIENLIASSFAVFLSRELEKMFPECPAMYHSDDEWSLVSRKK